MPIGSPHKHYHHRNVLPFTFRFTFHHVLPREAGEPKLFRRFFWHWHLQWFSTKEKWSWPQKQRHPNGVSSPTPFFIRQDAGSPFSAAFLLFFVNSIKSHWRRRAEFVRFLAVATWGGCIPTKRIENLGQSLNPSIKKNIRKKHDLYELVWIYMKKTVNLGPNKKMHPHIEALVFFINFCPIKEGNGEKISGANASVILKFPDGLGTSPQASGGFPLWVTLKSDFRLAFDVIFLHNSRCRNTEYEWIFAGDKWIYKKTICVRCSTRVYCKSIFQDGCLTLKSAMICAFMSM